MASQVNPLGAGQVTEDPRFNERFGLSPAMALPAFIPFIGVPSNSVGNNGDFGWRQDGTVAGHTVIYHREAGAWVATGA